MRFVLAAIGVGPAISVSGNNNLTIVNNPQGDYKITAGPDFFAYDDAAILTPATIQRMLAGSNVTAHTGTNGANTQPGDLVILSPVTSPGGGSSFGIQAARNITGTASVDTSWTGAGGSLSLTATAGMISIADLTARSLNSAAAGRGGSITLSGSTGVTAGALHADSTSGSGGSSTGGNVTITTSSGDILIGSIFAETDAGTLNGAGAGNVAATANAGSITITGQVNAAALSGNGSKNAGSINLHASGPLTLGDQVSATSYIGLGTGSASTGGAITLYGSQISLAGRVNASSEVDSSVFSVSGTAGNAGSILITSTSSISAAQNIVAYSHSKSGAANSGGAITITANSSASFGGYIGAESKVRTSGNAGHGGTIIVTAAGAITFSNDVYSYSMTPIGTALSAGNVTLASVSASLTGQNIYAYAESDNNTSGRGGDVNVSASGAISLQNVSTYSYAGSGIAGAGGNIQLTSSTASIAAQAIDASAFSNNNSAGAGGNVTLQAASSIDITNYVDVSSTGTSSAASGSVSATAPTLVHIANLDARSSTGVGGAVTLTSDEINIGSGLATIQGKGALTLQPSSASRGIVVFAASDSASTLDLLSTEMSSLANGFSSITIGRSDGTGAIIIKSGSVNDPITVRSPGGSITQSGVLTATDNASVNYTATSVSFGNSSGIYTQSNPITLNGAIHLSGNATLATTSSGTGAQITINGAIDGSGSLSISTGASSLTLSPPSSYSGGTNILSGKLAIANANAIGTGPLSIASGAAVTLSSALGNGVSVSGLAIAASGNLNLADNSIIVNYVGASPIASIHSALVSGFSNGSWNGNGISSTAAAADTTLHTGIGYAEASALGLANGGSFAGRTVAGQAILLKYTYYGDCDLDGKVTLNDFSIFVDGFNGLGSGWVYGDFDYNGIIDTNDFSMFLDGYKAHGPALSGLENLINSNPELSQSQRNALLSVVPEPVSGSSLLLFAAGTIMRRRRKSV